MASPIRRRPAFLNLQALERRDTPVVGKFDLAPIAQPGTGFDGVVQVSVGDGAGTGSLLYTGRHILTAAHVVANDKGVVSQPATVSFDLPNVGKINIVVQPANVFVHPRYGEDRVIGPDFDLAIITLPALAPSGPAGVGAERYNLYRTADEIGQTFTVVGYGTVGTGTTGEQPNEAQVKRMGRNVYDVVGDKLGYSTGTSLLYDLDNGQAANDAFGRIFGINDLGLPDEGSGAAGDSGGPVFVSVNGARLIIGTTTSGPKPNEPANPAEVNSKLATGFGSISHDMRMSTFAPFIDGRIAGAAEIVLDLRSQVVGRDDVADAIVVRLNGANLELVVNGSIYHSLPLADVTSLKLIGAGETGTTPFATTATIQNGVPTTLAITYERILTATDARTATPTVTMPAGDATTPTVATPPATPPAPELRPTPRLDLGEVPNAFSPSSLVAIGAGAGAGRVTVVDTANNNAVAFNAQPFGNFTGGITTALGDVTGDFVSDLILGAGAGGGPRVQVIDGSTRAVIRDFFAFESTFTGGVAVASGDVNGDGVDDIAIAAGFGGAPRILVLDGATGAVIRDFFAYENTLRTGVTVAIGDVDDDGFADIVAGSGAGGGPRVRVFSGETGAVLKDFFAYQDSLRGGVFVAAGDLNGDGASDVITGAGPGGGPHVRAFDLVTGKTVLDTFAYDSTFTGGVRVAVADADGDGLAEVIVGPGAGTTALPVRAIKVDTGDAVGKPFTFDPAFLGGVFVGGQG